MIELPRSTYYYRPSAAHTEDISDDQLRCRIEDIQDELPGYGYCRVSHELRARGHVVNHKRVARVMRMNGLGIKSRRRFTKTTDSDHAMAIYPNLYCNQIPVRPDRVWVADITFVGISSGFVYLAVILDACSRKRIAPRGAEGGAAWRPPPCLCR